MTRIITLAKRKVRPSPREQKAKSDIAKYTLDLVNSEIAATKKICNAELGGSFAKGTWLTGSDIDIFVVFETSVSEKELRDVSERMGFASLADHKPYVRYASHPYVEAMVRGTRVNVVPCYGVKRGDWKSAADRSRYHTAFMQKSLTDSMRDDVRVLKKLLQTNRLYGAELAREAFSGYSCEVMIHAYGTLEKLIHAIASAQHGLVIGKSSIKPKTGIAIMDPIDSTRNLATAVSVQNMGRLIMLCRAFEKNPSSAMIFTKPRAKVNPEVLKNTVTVRFTASLRSPETIWGQAKSAASALANRLDSNGFGVIRYGAHVTDSMQVTLAFVLESLCASKWSVGLGPQYFDGANALQFSQKNVTRTPLVWVGSDARLHTLRKRNYEKVSDLLSKTLSVDLPRSGIPTGLQRDIRSSSSIRVGIRASDHTIIGAISDLVSTDARTVGYYR